MTFAHRLHGFAAWALVSVALTPLAWGASPPTINANDRVAECRNPYVSVWLNPTVTSSVDPLPSVTFANRISSDPNGYPGNVDPDNYPVGPRVVTISACDHSTPTKNCSSKSVNITVRDTLGPKVTIAANKQAQCVSPSGTPAAAGYCIDTCRTASGSCDPNTAAVCQSPNQQSAACNSCNTQYNTCVSITCPQDANYVHLDKPAVTDVCDPNPTSSNNAPMAPFMFPIGKTLYSVRAADYSGNVTNQNVTVQVIDTVAPKFDPSAVPPFNVVSNAGNANRCVTPGGGSGTSVTLTHPNATDVCTVASKISYSWRVQGGAETANPSVCMADGNNTVQFIARDAAGNTDTSGGAAAKTTNVQVAQSGNFKLAMTVNTGTSSLGYVQQGKVNASVTGSTGNVTWNLVGATSPDSAPGVGTSVAAIYSTEGSYCPLYVSATDSTGKGGASPPLCFSVDRTLPSHSYAALTAVADPVGSVLSSGAQLPLDIYAADSNGVVLSGVARVTAYAQNSANANFLFYDNNTYCPQAATPTALPSCASTRHVSGCNQVGAVGCSCTNVGANNECTTDGRIDMSVMAAGNYNMVIAVTDLAGNTNTTYYPFTVASLPIAMVNDPNNPVGGLAGLLGTLATASTTPATARSYVTLARQYVQSAGSIFYESPGQALLLLRQAWTQLDIARSNGANVASYQSFLANIAEGEVRRILVAFQARANNGNLVLWNFLDDAGTSDRYKTRQFLTKIGGNFRDYSINPLSTLNLANGLLSLSVQHIIRGETSQAIDSAVSTFDSLSTLFRDSLFAELYKYPGGVHKVDVGTPSNPNLISENYFRQGVASHFGNEVGRTVAAQIARFSTRAQGGALFGVSASTVNTLAAVNAQIGAFTNALSVVQNANWNVGNANGFSNRQLVQQVYLPAVNALQTLQTLSGASIYTRYWQTGLGLTLADVVNFSMYEGPTALTCILWGMNDDSTNTTADDGKYAGCSQQQANSNVPLIYSMSGSIYANGKTPDWEAQTAECRYSRMLYALGDGRLLGNNAGALDLFVQSKCNIINLYNRYYAARTPKYIADDTAIDPNAYGCPTTPATFAQSDAIAACGGCNVQNGSPGPADTTCDGIDNDCNGLVDDSVVSTSCGCPNPNYACPCSSASACYNGQALPCVPRPAITTVDTVCSKIDNACTGNPGAGYVPTTCGVGGCVSYSACSSGTETSCTPKPAQSETCNGADDNCNITVDEGLDNDLDGYGCTPCTQYTTSSACTAQLACTWSGGACTGQAACSRCNPSIATCTAPNLCIYDKTGTGAWTGVWDCNDQDPTIFPGNPEVCDGKDNNCNGQVDEGVLNACGDCNPACQGTLIGRGGTPFNPTSVNATNISQNPNGDLGLTTQNLNMQYAWIANDTAGTVSKLDMTTGKEVARYCQALKTGVTSFANGTDPTGASYDTRAEPTVCAGCGGCNNGSRTAVDKSGNMLIANRAYSDNGYVGTYSKIAGNTAGCVDVNGDGVIQTSADKNGDGVIDPNQGLNPNVREYWGELDECILYTRKPITWDAGLKQPSCNQPGWPPNDYTKDPTNTSFADEKATCLADPNVNASGLTGVNGVCQWVNACNGSGDTTCSAKTSQAACNLNGNCQWAAPSCVGVSGCSSIGNQSTCNLYAGYCTWQTACSAKPCANNANNMVACKAATGCSWNQDCFNVGEGPLTNVNYPMPRSMTIDAQGDAWVGLFNRQAFVQINTSNGYIKRYAYTGYSPYGSSLDQYGILWHGDSCCGSQYLAGLNTNPNTVIYKNPDNGNATFTWPPFGTQASATKSPGGSYGVATDRKGYVYIGSYPLVNIAGFRFDAYRNSWTAINSSKDSKGNVLADAGIGRGTAVGADNTIWIAQMGNSGGGRVTGFNPNTLLPTVDVDFGTNGRTPIGVGIGYAGRIWTSNQGSYNAAVVDPTTGSVGYYPVGGPPYCYSDFTGAVLRTFTSPTGTYQEVIDACYGFPVSSWVSLQWSGILPIGTANQGRSVSNTAVRFRVRGTNKLVTRDASGNPVDPGTASQWSLWFPDDASDPNKSTSDPNRVYYYDSQPSSQWPTTGPCAGQNSSTQSGSSYYVNSCAVLSAVPTTYTFDSTGPQPISYLQVQSVLVSDSDNTVQPTLINFQLARTCPQF